MFSMFSGKNKKSKKQAPTNEAPQLSNADQQMLSNQMNVQQINSNMNNINMQQAPQNFPAQQQFQQQAQMQMQMPMMQQQQQMPSMGGVYGNRMQQQMGGRHHVEMPQFFNDDQPLIEKVKEQTAKEAKINIQIKAQRSMAKLKEQVMLPAMCSLTTEGGNRTSVDLICVIDISGSMSGQKLDLVKQTMKYLIETLTPADRLSIITFESYGERICGLKTVKPQNIPAFDDMISSIQSRGGTNINSGLELALKTLRDRKHVNKVTSVFLLSDGQDRGAQNQFRAALKREENLPLGAFSINSFGFGQDHDEDLMTKICKMKDGDFYFIKELATLDEAFCNALGGIISLVATDVVIKLNNISQGMLQGVKINKTYGEMWKKVNDKQYQIRIQQLMSGISKDYVFEIFIPNINGQVGDVDRDHNILQSSFTAKGINNVNMTGQFVFKLTLLNQMQEIPEINENIDVIENYLRVKATEAIEVNMKMAENQQYEQAQQGIDNMIKDIQGNKKARKDKMEYLVNDLQNIKQKCSKQDYQTEGKKWMKSAQMAHGAQQNYAYSNCVQQEMVMNQKSKKMQKH